MLRFTRLSSGLAALTWLALGAVSPMTVRADDGVSYSPAPAYLGSAEEFSACGFQADETADLVMDSSAFAQATAGGDGCLRISQQTPTDMNPTAHLMSLKGETSGNEQDGAFVVMPPMILEQVVQVAPGGVAILDGQFFPPLHTLSVIPQGGLPPSAAVSDPDGKLMVQIPVPPMAAPGTYPVLFQDSNDPVWIANNQPSVSIIVLPQPTDATGNWNLNATTTLKRDDGKVTANGVGTTTAQFAVSGGQLKGQGTLAITLDMSVGDASCHGQAAPTPFTVSGAASGGMFHLQFSGANAAITITVTCNNGLSLPTTLPGDSASAPFDIQATDGQTVDIDGSNTFLMVPPGFSGHTHVVLAKG